MTCSVCTAGTGAKWFRLHISTHSFRFQNHSAVLPAACLLLTYLFFPPCCDFGLRYVLPFQRWNFGSFWKEIQTSKVCCVFKHSVAFQFHPSSTCSVPSFRTLYLFEVVYVHRPGGEVGARLHPPQKSYYSEWKVIFIAVLSMEEERITLPSQAMVLWTIKTN